MASRTGVALGPRRDDGATPRVQVQAGRFGRWSPDSVSVDDVPTNAQLSNAAEPLVSFVVPAYNEATLLPETLGRIRDLDTEITYETIVVNGGSDDDTRFLAAAYGAILDRSGERSVRKTFYTCFRAQRPAATARDRAL